MDYFAPLVSIHATLPCPWRFSVLLVYEICCCCKCILTQIVVSDGISIPKLLKYPFKLYTHNYFKLLSSQLTRTNWSLHHCTVVPTFFRGGYCSFNFRYVSHQFLIISQLFNHLFIVLQDTVQEARRHQIHDQRLPLLQPGSGHQRCGCRGYRAREHQGKEHAVDSHEP